MKTAKTKRWGLTIFWLGVLLALLALISRQGQAGAGAWWAADECKMAARLGATACAILLWFRTQALISARGNVPGIVDALHLWSEPWNDSLRARPRLTNGMLIVSSALIDLFGLFLLGAGIWGPTMRPFLALLLVFVFRQVCQVTCALPTPPKMIWHHPGFPSLLVTYGVANDFFISGHTAIAVLGAIEIARICPWWWGVAAGLIALGEAAMVIVLRAHYTMDVLAAATAAWCAAQLALSLSLALGI